MKDEIAIIGVGRYRLLRAANFLERMRGLSGFDAMREDGMVFLMPFSMRWPVWMRGMSFDIDVLWVNRWRIVDMVAGLNAGAGSLRQLRPHFPRSPADVIIELRSGVLGPDVRKGDLCIISS